MMLSLDTAYRSFGGEVEASSTPTICRLPDSRRHQLWAIAPASTAKAVMWSSAGADDNRAAKARTSSPAGSVGTLKPCLRAFRADLCFPVREMGPVLTL